MKQAEMPIPNRVAGHAGLHRVENGLFTDTEFLDKGAVTGQVVLLQVIQQAPAPAYEVHQAAVGRKVFFVGLQVRRNLVHALGDKGNLGFNRPGVGSSAAKFGENARLFFFGY
jgi:hypothetical protein